MSANKKSDGILQPVKIGSFTFQQVTAAIVAWLVLYAVGSIFISNPFWTEIRAGADINYAHIMYLHGLLIALAGMSALLVCQVFQIRARFVRSSILAAVVVAIVLSTLGGIFDVSIHRDLWKEFWFFIHILGFFTLDFILLSLLIGFYLEWHNHAEFSRSMPFLSGYLATFGMFTAAIMGHIAGWILDNGEYPRFIGDYARMMGVNTDGLKCNMIGAHSHLMVVSLLALIVSMSALRFGYQTLGGGPRLGSRIGFLFIIAGMGIITVVYILSGFSVTQPPVWFQSGHNGVNGIASDDMISGIGIMLGGLLVFLSLFAGNRGIIAMPTWLKSALTAMGIAWLFLVVTVVGGGFWIELHEQLFGAGHKAPLAAADAVFTFFHQDYAFFLIPAVILLLLIADIYLPSRKTALLSFGMIVGLMIAFLGGMLYVFVDPFSVYGAGYYITGSGYIIIAFMSFFFVRELLRTGKSDGLD